MTKIKILVLRYYLELFTLVLFLVLLPLSLQVNFIQNDDWNRTLTTQEFIKGNFTLRPETANTFYLQGILGMLFYFLTGSMRFPLLTLLFSVLNFYIFGQILKRHFGVSAISVLTLALLFFLNPFHIYSIWGFMAENFYLFFTLLSLLFFFEFEQRSSVKKLVIANVFCILGFFIKQVSLVTALSYIAYLGFGRKWKYLLIQVGITAALILYYYFLFPRTQEMHVKDITLEKITDFRFSFSLTWANLVYTVAFTLPLYFIALKRELTIKKILLLSVSIILSGIAVATFFNANSIGIGEFPYIQNTFTRAGFYSLNLHGQPYQHKFVYDMFTYWQLGGVLLAYTLMGLLSIHIRKLNTPVFYFYFGYLALMLLIVEMFDRYLLPVFPIFILLLLKIIKDYKRTDNLLVLPFVLFLGFINYQYSMDFVISNHLMFTKAQAISVQERVSFNQILVNSAWRKVYSGQAKVFRFSYDGPNSEELLTKGYRLVETLKVDYPFNTHLKPFIYIYKNDQNLK